MHDNDQHEPSHDDDQNEEHQSKLDSLRLEHRDLDQVIQRLVGEPDIDDFQLQRMKKRKLYLKDQISQLESTILTNANA
jgi:hypothetical protein